MILLRNLAGDLVEKRLWPIAAALLAAIVAIPLVLGAGGSSTSTGDNGAPAPGASAAAAQQTAQVRLDTSAPASVRRRSKARNPFTSRSMPKDPAAAAVSTTTAATSTAAASTTAATVTPSVSKSTPATTVSQPAKNTTAPAKKTTTVVTHKKPSVRQTAYRVAWRFGEAGAEVGNHNAARLTALPTAAQPAIHFLGLRKRKSGTAAVFLLERGVQVDGDGRCDPDPATCQTLEMRAGDIELIDVASGTGGLVQYRFHLVHIDRKKVTKATAKRLRLRESKAGRQSLRSAIDAGVPGVAKFVFDRTKGLLAPYVPKLND